MIVKVKTALLTIHVVKIVPLEENRIGCVKMSFYSSSIMNDFLKCYNCSNRNASLMMKANYNVGLVQCTLYGTLACTMEAVDEKA